MQTSTPSSGDELIILVDDRERIPLDFGAARTARVHLPVGDYSAAECTDLVALERKRVDELATCCGIDRERFLAQAERLRAYAVRGIVIEGTFADLAAGRYASRIRASSVVGTLVAVSTDWTIPIWHAGDAHHAAMIVERILRRVHRRRHEIRAALPLIAEMDPAVAAMITTEAT